MLIPEDAAERLALSGRLGMDDPTEVQSVRWYWNQVTGELNRSGWRDPCPKEFPVHKRESWEQYVAEQTAILEEIGETTAPPLEPRKVPDVADGDPEKLLEPYHYGSMKAPIVNGL
jgi:hypothetical protein